MIKYPRKEQVPQAPDWIMQKNLSKINFIGSEELKITIFWYGLLNVSQWNVTGAIGIEEKIEVS